MIDFIRDLYVNILQNYKRPTYFSKKDAREQEIC